ncbi:unnamed protein product, partial [Ascophyllum nodosum]
PDFEQILDRRDDTEMMTCSAGRVSTGPYQSMISVLMIAILFTNHAAYGSASEHHHQHQLEATIDASAGPSNQTLLKDYFITAFGSCGTYKDTLVEEELSEAGWLVTEQ